MVMWMVAFVVGFGVIWWAFIRNDDVMDSIEEILEDILETLQGKDQD